MYEEDKQKMKEYQKNICLKKTNKNIQNTWKKVH